MATIIFILILLAAYHWIYEAIVMPNIRHEMRYRFFELRDRLRSLKIHDEKLPSEVFQQVDYSINSSIKHLPYLSFSVLIEARKAFDGDEKLKNTISKKVDLIRSCENKDVIEISEENTRLTAISLFLNSGSWLIYLIPFIIIGIFAREVHVKIKSFAQAISLTPEYKFQGFVPSFEH